VGQFKAAEWALLGVGDVLEEAGDVAGAEVAGCRLPWKRMKREAQEA
jgi:hypothetical protein